MDEFIRSDISAFQICTSDIAFVPFHFYTFFSIISSCYSQRKFDRTSFMSKKNCFQLSSAYLLVNFIFLSYRKQLPIANRRLSRFSSKYAKILWGLDLFAFGSKDWHFLIPVFLVGMYIRSSQFLLFSFVLALVPVLLCLLL